MTRRYLRKIDRQHVLQVFTSITLGGRLSSDDSQNAIVQAAQHQDITEIEVLRHTAIIRAGLN